MESNKGGILGGIAVAILAGLGLIGKFALRSTDDVVRGAARFGDDVVTNSARFGDDVAHSARFGDELSNTTRFGSEMTPQTAEALQRSTRSFSAAQGLGQQTTRLKVQSVQIGSRIDQLSLRLPVHLTTHLLRRYHLNEVARAEAENDLAAAGDEAQIAAVKEKLAALEKEQALVAAEVAALEKQDVAK